jgi:hypothetical protein
VVHLPYKGEKRTVLISKHACRRIAKRAGVRGSHVAFVAKSIIRNKIVFSKQSRQRDLLTIYGWKNEVLGYCPIDEDSYALEGRLQPKPFGGVLELQPRWILVTFMTPKMVKEDELQPLND